MAPKKKTTVAVGQSEARQPVPTRGSSGPVAERTRGTAREHQHHPSSRSLGGGDVCAPGNGPHIAKSKGGARPSAGGAGPSKVTAAPPEGLQDSHAGANSALLPGSARRMASSRRRSRASPREEPRAPPPGHR